MTNFVNVKPGAIQPRQPRPLTTDQALRLLDQRFGPKHQPHKARKAKKVVQNQWGG